MTVALSVRRPRLFRAGLIVAPGIALGLGAVGIGRLLSFGGMAAMVLLLVPHWALLVASLIAGKYSVVAGFALTPFTLLDVFLLVWLVRQIPLVLSQRGLRFTRAAAYLTGFLAWAWVCTLMQRATITPLARISLYGVVGLVMVLIRWPADASARRSILWAILLFDLFELAISASQFSTRLVGTTVQDPGVFGIYLMTGLAILRGGALQLGRYHHLVQAALFIGILATRSRGVWLATLVLIAMSRLQHVNRRSLFSTLALFGVIGVLLYGPVTNRLGLNVGSAQLRTESIRAGMATGMAKPVTGTGWAGLAVQARLEPGELSYLSEAERFRRAIASPFNLFVNTFASTGVPGLVLLVMYFVSVLGSASRHDRAVFLFLAAFASMSLTEMTLYAGAPCTLLFFALAAFAEVPEARASDGLGAPEMILSSPSLPE